jgi:hypothetical protein
MGLEKIDGRGAKKYFGELGCSLVVECLPGMYKALGLIPCTEI